MLVPTPSSTSAARETHQQNTRRWLRLAFVITIIVNWCLIGLRLLLSPAFFSQPNDLGYILEPVLSLAVYAAVGLACSRAFSGSSTTQKKPLRRCPVCQPRSSPYRPFSEPLSCGEWRDSSPPARLVLSAMA